jgi:non-ribosomal peptide synthetase component F
MIPHSHKVRHVHELVAEQAARRPGSAAVVPAGVPSPPVTYGQLDRSANRLAHYLRNMGVGPETLVGVYLERGADVVRCLLAILKAGGGYLPLDPSVPSARLAQMCAEAGPAAILGPREALPAVPYCGAKLVALDELSPELARLPGTAPRLSLHPDNLAYAICTSGSTGQPKAVAVSHGSLACLIRELPREYRFSPRDRVLQLASLGFDTSLEQMLATLSCGATSHAITSGARPALTGRRLTASDECAAVCRLN